MGTGDLRGQRSLVSSEARAARAGHTGGVLWFTGLPGSGKSTLAYGLEQRLFEQGYGVYVLDGDNVRMALNADLGFTRAERRENLRRVGEVANLFAKAGFIVIAAFISPYGEMRTVAREASELPFHEFWISAGVEVCEARDPKGHYARARAGDLPDFTGVSAPYEAPETPQLTVPSGSASVEECLRLMEDYVARHFRDGAAAG